MCLESGVLDFEINIILHEFAELWRLLWLSVIVYDYLWSSVIICDCFSTTLDNQSSQAENKDCLKNTNWPFICALILWYHLTIQNSIKDLVSLFGKRLRRKSIKMDAPFPFFVVTAWKDNLNLGVLQLKVTLRINVWTVCSVLIKPIWSPRLVWTSGSWGFCWKSSGKQRN